MSNETLSLTDRDNTPVLVDAEGGVWWPTDEAAEIILGAEDQLAEAIRQMEAGNGGWRG